MAVLSDGMKPHEQVWIVLAELFFLDSDPDAYEIRHAATQLIRAGVDPESIRRLLIEEIAPVAGANVGYAVYPVIGAWSGFDPQDLCEKIQRSIAARPRRPKWYLALKDRLMRHTIRWELYQRLIKEMSEQKGSL